MITLIKEFSMKKIHPSWDYMRPNVNEKYEDFRFEEYYQRIVSTTKLNHIPKTIFEQWIYYLHQDYNTLNNYAWINYENVEFTLSEWDLDQLENVNVIEDFKSYYLDRASYSRLDQFCCTKEDLYNWKEKGTWKTPPIIIDVNTFLKDKPSWSELTPPYQLIEGHTRLGYLNSLKRISSANKGGIAPKHLIYLMTRKSNYGHYKKSGSQQ